MLACIAIGSAWLAITAMGREDALLNARENENGGYGLYVGTKCKNRSSGKLGTGPNDPVTRGGEEKRVIQAPARAK